MLLLHLTQHGEKKGRGKNPKSRHRVKIRLEGIRIPAERWAVGR